MFNCWRRGSMHNVAGWLENAEGAGTLQNVMSVRNPLPLASPSRLKIFATLNGYKQIAMIAIPGRQLRIGASDSSEPHFLTQFDNTFIVFLEGCRIAGVVRRSIIFQRPQALWAQEGPEFSGKATEGPGRPRIFGEGHRGPPRDVGPGQLISPETMFSQWFSWCFRKT